METLNKLLGVEQTVDLSIDIKNDDNDIYKTFIDNYNEFTKTNPNLNNNQHLNDELGILQNKQKQIDESIETVIPELKDYLTNFNTQLSDFTTELGFIRHKSTELKSLLENNSKKLSKISPLVNDLIIPPKVISSIIYDKINSSWQDNISFLKDKKEIYAKYKNEQNEKTSNDLLPLDFEKLCELLELLKDVILERSKKFIISKIKILRNGQPVPSQRVQRQMLQVHQIYEFIIENNYSLALEIRQAYSYTMKWYYKEYFGRYIRSLTILPFKTIDTQYSLGNILLNVNNANNAANYASSLFTSYLGAGFITTITNDMINEYFQINKRLAILTQQDNTVMVSQIAEHNNNKDNFIEIGFKNLNLAILDNFTVEFSFMKNFFRVSDNVEEINGLVEQIFQPTFTEALQYTEMILINQYMHDIFGTLISIRIANQLIIESRKRLIPTVENYIEDQLMLLWPKFQQLIDWQAESLNSIDISQIQLDETTALVSPIELTISFAYFLQSLLILTTNGVPDSNNIDEENNNILVDAEGNAEDIADNDQTDETSEPLYNSILRIRNDFEMIMTKFSKTIKSPEKFLSINYLHLYNALQQQSLALMESNELYHETNDNSILKDTEAHYKTLVEAFNQR